MKKRVQITLEEELIKRSKGKIKNLSAFLNKCLFNYLKNNRTQEEKQEDLKKKIQEEYIINENDKWW